MRPRFVATVLAVLALVAACSGAPEQQAAGHNEQDVRFAQEMIPHHSQAVDMAKLVPTRAADPAVKALATRIEQAQAPEIEQLRGWLSRWGAPAEAPGHGGHHAMAGMMTGEDMRALEQARGTEFDRLWLTMMIKHHEGAVEMARAEVAGGSDPEAKALAQRIIETQQAEIDEMRAKLPQG
nr:DUF305 domain-containing protein [Amycolatopsis suaedae]